MKLRIIVYSFLIISLLMLLLSCGGDDPVSPEDKTDPTVTSVIPADNTQNVSIDADIVVIFSETINSNSISSASFIITPPITGSYAFNGNTITFLPASQLAYGTDYTISLTTDITDLAGNNLSQVYNWSFSTIPDPATVPPEIINVNPTDNSDNIAVDNLITVTFTKPINASSINSTSFIISGGITGQYNVANSIVTFTPDFNFVYDSLYTVTLTTAITDTFGINLEADFLWSFRTVSLNPTAVIFSPQDSSIIGDSVLIEVITSHPIYVDYVAFFIDDNLTPSFTDFNEPFEFDLDASAYEIGSEHLIYTIAYDSAGNFGFSDTLTFYYLWQEMITDGNDEFNPLEVPNDLRRMLARSTDSTLELRYEYAFDWEFAYADPSAGCTITYNCGDTDITVYCRDTAVDLGIFIDTDLNPLTGRRDAAGDTLNDIGADYRIILGLHGGDTTLSVWNSGTQVWELIYDTTGLLYHNVKQNTNIMEISLRWDDIDNTNSVHIVSANVFFRNFCEPNDFLADFMPDRGNGHITINRRNQFIGKVYNNKTSFQIYNSQNISVKKLPPNPFN